MVANAYLSLHYNKKGSLSKRRICQFYFVIFCGETRKYNHTNKLMKPFTYCCVFILPMHLKWDTIIRYELLSEYYSHYWTFVQIISHSDNVTLWWALKTIILLCQRSFCMVPFQNVLKAKTEVDSYPQTTTHLQPWIPFALPLLLYCKVSRFALSNINQ